MSRPPPPPSFPMSNPNVTHSSTYPPPGPVHPPQTSNHGNYPPQQPTTYPTPQLLQLPSAHGTRYPHHPVNTHAPASTYSYSSSPPHPSAHLPLSGPPHASPAFPIPSVQGGYGASNNSSGPPPPHMPQRIATMPTPGQVHNPHLVPYHNVSAPGIAHQQSHSGMSGVARSVTGDWSHHDQSYPQNENLGQRPEVTSHISGDYVRERGPPSDPYAGQLPQCQYCGKPTPRATYEKFKGFCKEKHKKEWYAKHSQN